MGLVTVRSLTDKVALKLLDAGGVRWLIAERLADYNMTVKTVCNTKTDAYVLTPIVATTSDARQVLPAGGVQMRRARQWMGTNGTIPGNIIKQMDRDDLDANLPDWMATTGSSIEGFVIDEEDPLAYYIYPQVVGRIRLEYGAVPADTSDLDSLFPLDDVYEQAAFSGMMALALLKSSKNADVARAGYWQQQFNTLMGLKAEAQSLFQTRPAAQEQAGKKA